MSSSALPPVSELLSGYGFNNSPPATPLHLTYYFETSVPTAGSWAGDPTWTPFSAAEQSYVQAALADVSAFANVTFTQVYQMAELNYGNSTSQALIGTDFGRTQVPTPKNPVAYTAFNGAYFSPTPLFPYADNDYLATHELANALGLLDYYAMVTWNIPAQYTNSQYTTMAGDNFNTSANAPPGYENPVGFQLLDIAALQYLYGVNENGYTPSYQNTTATLTGSDLTYAITSASADETIWVGSNVASVTCLDFSACTSSVAVNLNAGSFSSSYVGPAIYAGYAAGGNDSIAIALNTVFNVGVSDNQASTLIADAAPGHNDVLLGGSGNDSFTAGAGEDIFIGGGGTDTAIFHDAAADYIIQSLGVGVLVVTDDAAVPTDGTIVLDGSFTSLQFADHTVAESANVAPSGSTDVVSAPAAILSADQGALAYLVGVGKISVYAACYCRGTRIQAERGEVAIEDLAIGDRLVIASGALRPIKWIGKRSYSGRFLRANPQLWPIAIRAGALAEQIPARDLFVSPLHAMFLDGILIPAENLVNGESIARVERLDRVEYFHIELESHDVILAEGAESETFVDDDSRTMFHNADSYAEQFPQAAPTPAHYCAPRLTRGCEVQAVRNRLATRAGQQHRKQESALFLVMPKGCYSHDKKSKGFYSF